MKNLSSLEDKIGYRFKNKDLLRQALVHRSYLNESRNFKLGHNERLEYLGDAVLELVITHFLYQQFKELAEGELTNLRAAVVRGDMLARVARELELNRYILLSRGEQRGNDKARQYITANALEALIGALYLDQGYEAAKTFVKKYIASKLPEIVKKGLHIDSKSRFQELAQEKYRITPVYKVLREEGLDHDKCFVVGLFLGKRKISEGSGSSKQQAHQQAAKKALEKMEPS